VWRAAHPSTNAWRAASRSASACDSSCCWPLGRAVAVLVFRAPHCTTLPGSEGPEALAVDEFQCTVQPRRERSGGHPARGTIWGEAAQRASAPRSADLDDAIVPFLDGAVA
jgi:hypothetical protein